MIRLVPAGAYFRTPWKNGGGWSLEIASANDEAGIVWRVGLADIECNGPFSEYAGILRWFSIVTGAGVQLAFPESSVQVRRNETHAFPGTPAPGCALIEGPSRAFNLLMREGFGTAASAVVGGGPEIDIAPARVLMVHALQGIWRLGEITVPTGDTLIGESVGASKLSGPPSGRATLVAIR